MTVGLDFVYDPPGAAEEAFVVDLLALETNFDVAVQRFAFVDVRIGDSESEVSGVMAVTDLAVVSWLAGLGVGSRLVRGCFLAGKV